MKPKMVRKERFKMMPIGSNEKGINKSRIAMFGLLIICCNIFDHTLAQPVAVDRSIRRKYEESIPARIADFKTRIDKLNSDDDVDPRDYAQTVLELCGRVSLGGKYGGSTEASREAEKAAVNALVVAEHADSKNINDLSVRCGLTYFFTHHDAQESFAAMRKKKAELLLDIWRDLNAEMDPNWDPSELVISPDSFTHREHQLFTDDQIKEMRKRSGNFDRQYSLWRLKQRWLPIAERFLVESYIKEPRSVDELESLLKDYKLNDDANEKGIVAAVKAGRLPEKFIIKNTTKPAG